jgi:hypothetical protein
MYSRAQHCLRNEVKLDPCSIERERELYQARGLGTDAGYTIFLFFPYVCRKNEKKKEK